MKKYFILLSILLYCTLFLSDSTLAANPTKIKIGISGCPRCCGESRVRDIGIMGSAKGWTVYFGGHSGFKSRQGEQVATGLTSEQALACVRSLLSYYKAHAEPKERSSKFIERVGAEWIGGLGKE